MRKSDRAETPPQFFDDTAAFSELAKVVGTLIHQKSDDPIRVWVPDSSTGEAAYSVAIVLAEQLVESKSSRRVQIFATDIDGEAIAVARRGVYQGSIGSRVSRARLRRFFQLDGRGYGVAPALRRLITFATHDLVGDPPLPRLDVVVCRADLAALDAGGLKQVLAAFHFALEPGGYLVVNGAGIVDALDRLFAPVSKQRRTFRQRDLGSRPLTAFGAPVLSKERASNELLEEQVRDLTAINDELTNFIESSDVTTLLLDVDLRLRRFTAAATRLFNLTPSDIGRSVGHIRTSLNAVDLERDCSAVLDGDMFLERETAASDGRKYLLRASPYRSGTRRIIRGVVVTLLDITRLKTIEHDLRAAREQAAGDLRRMTCLHEVTSRLALSNEEDVQGEIVRAAVEIAGADMGTMQTCDESGVLAITAHLGFDRSFLEYFARVDAHTDTACGAAMAAHERVIVEDVTASPYFAGGSLPVLLAAGVKALQSTPLFDRSGAFVGMLSTHYRTVHRFDDSELRWLDLLARQAADLIVNRHREDLLSRTHERLELIIAERMKWLKLLHQVTRAIQDAPTWDEGVNAALGLICESERWQVGYVYVPDPENPDVIIPTVGYLRDERFRPFHALSEVQRHVRRRDLPGLVYDDGVVRWVNDGEELLASLPIRREAARAARFVSAVAMPITFGSQIIGVLELFSDEPHEPDQTLVNLMVDINAQIGKILERERMTADMADLVWKEQQGLLHTLHDTLGQTLTAVNVLSAALGHQLQASDAATAATARQITQQAMLALDQVRQLSRGMFPIDLEAVDMMSALRQLASATESIHKLRVHVDGDLGKTQLEGRVVTHLYRIAQEAVTNAVKHAQADTIRIELKSDRGVTRLRVVDNGVGLSGNGDHHEGLGLRVMRQRATSISATLKVKANASGGTTVACTLRPPPPLPTS